MQCCAVGARRDSAPQLPSALTNQRFCHVSSESPSGAELVRVWGVLHGPDWLGSYVEAASLRGMAPFIACRLRRAASLWRELGLCGPLISSALVRGRVIGQARGRYARVGPDCDSSLHTKLRGPRLPV